MPLFPEVFGEFFGVQRVRRETMAKVDVYGILFFQQYLRIFANL